MLPDDHDHFFQRGIAGSFAESVDGTFNLAGSGNNAGDGIGCGQTQIIMTMAGNNGFVDIGDMVHEIGDFFAILMRQAIAGGIGNIDDCGAGFDNGFDHPGQVCIIGAAGVFGIKFHIVDKIFGPFNGLYCPFNDIFAIGIEFGFDMQIRSADSGMNSWVSCFFERLRRQLQYLFLRPGSGRKHWHVLMTFEISSTE